MQNNVAMRNQRNYDRPVHLFEVECIFKSKDTNYGFATPINGEDDIFVHSKENPLFALEGDKVIIEISDVKKRRGYVKKILKRNSSYIVGEYNGISVNPILNFPPVFVSQKNNLYASTGNIVVVEILKFPEHGEEVEGKITEVLSLNSVVEAYERMLKIKFKLCGKEYQNNSVLKKQLKKIKSEHENTNLNSILASGRVDKTDAVVIAIDPKDARDFDDAIEISKKDNGNYLLTVHIADVSHYVAEGSCIDEKAAELGNSIYLPSRVIPMLPELISNEICSLRASELKLVLSFEMEIDPSGKLVSNNIYKSVICVNENITYEKAYDVITGKVSSEYTSVLKLMEELAKILEKKRKKLGSIELELSETKVDIVEGEFVGVKAYERTFANQIIEEFMIVCNEMVAEYLYYLDYPCIYRVHESPFVERIEEVFRKFGIEENLKTVTPKKISDILDSIPDENKRIAFSERILRAFCVAEYSEKAGEHFGLATKFYAHVTSPIRRYPDLFVHRILHAHLDGVSPEEITKKYEFKAIEYAQNSSLKGQEAKQIERAYENLYMCAYMSERIGEVFDARIENFTGSGVFVKLDNTVSGLIPQIKLRSYLHSLEEGYLVTPDGDVLTYGYSLKVVLSKVDLADQKIFFNIATS